MHMMTSFVSAALLGLMMVTVGCDQSRTPPASAPSQPSAAQVDTDHGHSHGEGPHGGTVADWGGGKYHVEFAVDHDKQEATVYILDGNAKNPAPVKAEKLLLSIQEPAFQVELMPLPLEDEAEGLSSRFIGKHEKLGVVQEFSGTISGEVDGKPYAGDFQEEAHGHSH